MSIKRRIVVFQLVVGLAVLSIAGLAYTAIEVMTGSLSRVQWSRQQLDVSTQVAILANRYSEQIAETLLIGVPELPDLEDARAGLAAAMSDARSIAEGEIATLTDPDERDEEGLELVRLDAMASLLEQIDEAVEELLDLRAAGRLDEAVAIFRSRIENRLDAEFERLIAEAVEDERREADVVDAEATALARRLLVLTGVLLTAVIGATIALAIRFYARIASPLQTLTDGTLAIAAGDLGHRVRSDRDDELGQLAAHFNRMAERLEREQGLLLAARSDLERQVAARTHELAHANRQLQETDRQRVRFLADVSHELRTPLTVLRGEAEVTLRGADKPARAYRDTLELIVQQAADMTRLVEDLLYVARSEADQIRFEFEPLDLEALVEEAVADAAVLARGTGMRFEVETGVPGIIVRADGRRLKQALLIVLDNAAKYATVTVPTRVQISREGAVAVVAVVDGGPGIAADELPYVANRFYRGENARGGGVGGSGLGLAIARRILETHGGSLEIESEPGIATRITLRLTASVTD